MRRTRKTLIPAAIAMLAALPSFAAEGRIPVWQPTVLSAPGKYVVTRNITANPGAPAIQVTAADVDLDLNGMEVLQPDSGVPAIYAPSPSGVRIHDGAIRGGRNGVQAGAGSKLILERLRVADTASDGLLLSDVDSQVVRDNVIFNVAGAGIQLDGNLPKTGSIADNVIRRTSGGIEVLGGTSLAIVHNRIEQSAFGPGLPRGVVLDGCAGVLVSDNTIQDISGPGISILGSGGHEVDRNVIRGAAAGGIFIDNVSHDNVLRANVITASGAGSGIAVYSSRNVLEGNLSNSNLSFGLVLGTSSKANVYRQNVARGNGGGGGPCLAVFTPDFCDNGIGNSTALDNFLPSPGM